MGKWDKQRRKPRKRKVIRRAPGSFELPRRFTDDRQQRQPADPADNDEELEELEALDRRLRLNGQWDDMHQRAIVDPARLQEV